MKLRNLITLVVNFFQIIYLCLVFIFRNDIRPTLGIIVAILLIPVLNIVNIFIEKKNVIRKQTLSHLQFTLLLGCIIYLEHNLCVSKRYSLAPVIAMSTTLNIIFGEEIVAPFATVVIYTNSTNFDMNSRSLIVTIFFMASFFIFAIIMRYNTRPILLRIKNRMRILRLLQKRLVIEAKVAETIISNHQSQELVVHTSSEDTPVVDVIEEPSVSYDPIFVDVKSKALEAGVVPAVIQTSRSVFSTRSAERRLCGVLVVKQAIEEGHDCLQSAAQLDLIYSIIDRLAIEHKITPIRRFRGLWIGSVGYFYSWEGSRTNCNHLVQMASEIILLSRRFSFSLCCSIEFGSIIGGFIGEAKGFDMFGPEIRWAVDVVDELNRAHEVFLSSSVKNMLLSSGAKHISETDFEPCFRHIKAVINGSFETFHVLDNIPQLAKRSPIEVVSLYRSSSNLNSKSSRIDWDQVSRIWSSDSLNYLFNPVSQTQFQETEIVTEALLEGHQSRQPTKSHSSKNIMADVGYDMIHPSNSFDLRSNQSTRSVLSSLKLSRQSTLNSRFDSVNDAEEVMHSNSTTESGVHQHKPSNSARKIVFHSLKENRAGGTLENRSTTNSLIYSSEKFLSLDDSYPFNYLRLFMNYLFPFSEVKLEGPFDPFDDCSWLDRLEDIYEIDVFDIYEGYMSLERLNEQVNIIVFELFFSKISYFINLKHVFSAVERPESPIMSTESKKSSPIPSVSSVLPHLRRMPISVFGSLYTNFFRSCVRLYDLIFEENEKDQQQNLINLTKFESNFTELGIKFYGFIIGIVSKQPEAKIEDESMEIRGQIPNTQPAKNVIHDLKSDHHETQSNLSDPLISRWLKYSSDIRKLSLFGHSFWLGAVNFITLTTLILTACAYYSFSSGNSLDFLYVMIPYISVVIFVGENHIESFKVYVLMLFLRFVGILYIAIGESETELDTNNVIIYLLKLIFFIHWFFAIIYRPLRYTILDLICLITIGSMNRLILRSDQVFALLQFICFFVFAFLPSIIFEYAIYVSFILENLLVPDALSNVEKQHSNTQKILKLFMPALTPMSAIRIMSTTRFRESAILTIHVKPYDVLPSLVNPREGAAFLELLHSSIDDWFAECGLVRIARFSGIFIAVTSKSLDIAAYRTVNSHLSYKQRAVHCILHIQKQLDIFNRAYKINSAMGVSLLNEGAIIIGASASRYSMDINGRIAAAGTILASRQSENAIISHSLIFQPEINSAAEKVKKVILKLPGFSAPYAMYTISLHEGSFGGQGRQLKDFEYIGMLGKGGYGSVHLVKDKSYDIKYAVKLIPKKKGSTSSDVMISREFQILTQMKDPNVTALKYCIVQDVRVYLVMEYVRGGNLKQVIDKFKPNVQQLMLWFAELVHAIEYVHSLGIIHRDIKPLNCMIDSSCHLKLGDFGLAKIVGTDDASTMTPDNIAKKWQNNDQGNTSMSATMSATMSAISLMQKVLPIQHNKTHIEGAVQMSGLIQALVIDSNSRRIEESCETLRSIMVETRSALNAEDSKSILSDASLSIDIVLLNVGLNADDMNWEWRLLHELRTMSSSESIPVIALSEYDDNVMQQRATELGAKEFILYPLHPDKHKDLILKNGMTRRRWKYEDVDNGENLQFNPQSPAFRHIVPRSGYPSPKATPTSPLSSEAAKQPQFFENLPAASGGPSNDSISTCPDDILEKEDGSTMASNLINASGNLGNSLLNSSPAPAADFDIEINKPKAVILDNENEKDNMVPDVEKMNLKLESNALEHHSAVGTANFMAPEIITDRKYDKAVDWWACGITFYFCITRQHLFKGSQPNAIFRQITRSEIDLSSITDLNLKALISRLLERDYKKRLGTVSTEEIKTHAFFAAPDFESVRQRPGPFTSLPEQLGEISLSIQEKEEGEAAFLGVKPAKKMRVSSVSVGEAAKNKPPSGKKSGHHGISRGKYSSKGKSSSGRSMKRRRNRELHKRVANSQNRDSYGQSEASDDTSHGKRDGPGSYSLGSHLFRNSFNVADQSIKETDEFDESDSDEFQSGHNGMYSIIDESKILEENAESRDFDTVITSTVHDNFSLQVAAGEIASRAFINYNDGL